MEWYDENGDVWVLRPKPSGPRGRKFPQNNVSFFKISLVLVVFYDLPISASLFQYGYGRRGGRRGGAGAPY